VGLGTAFGAVIPSNAIASASARTPSKWSRKWAGAVEATDVLTERRASFMFEAPVA
jgi:hypothetical protein